MQYSLLARGRPEFDPGLEGLTRIRLSPASWLDVLPEWLHASDVVFEALVARVPWRQYRRPMYERIVDEPRLTASYGPGEPAPLEVLDDARRALAARYGEPLDTTGLNYYRDGSDSVAWHGDRIGRNRVEALVCIVSVGRRRPFRLRPAGGGPARRFELGDGDLFVMGGACQREFEHCVPKVARGESRISVTFRTGTTYGAAPPSWAPYRIAAGPDGAGLDGAGPDGGGSARGSAVEGPAEPIEEVGL